MRRSTLLCLVLCGLVAAGLYTANGGLLALAIPFLLYLAAGLLYAPDSPQLKITRSLSHERVMPGQSVRVTVTLTNHGPALEELYFIDHVPQTLHILEGETKMLTALAAGQSVQLSYEALGRRGLHRFHTVEIVVQDTLGLFQRRVTLQAAAQFFVLPEITKVRRVEIRPRRVGVYSGLIPARLGGPGVEFFGLREYQPGDPPRWLNARATARYPQKLFVNQFEQERMAEVGLIVDARQVSDIQVGEESLFEYSIQATATLADSLLGGGNRVGLLLYGRAIDWTFPGYGKVQLERLMRALARAEQGSGEVFEGLDHLPTWLFPARTQIILISPLLPDDAEMLLKVRARGYHLLVISPNPISFEQRKLAKSDAATLATRIARLERELLLRKLSHAQIQVVDWPVETPFRQVAHTALSRLSLGRG